MLGDRSKRSQYVQAIPFPLRGYGVGLDHLDLHFAFGRFRCCSITWQAGGGAYGFGTVYRDHGGLLGCVRMETGPKSQRRSLAVILNVVSHRFFSIE